MKAFEFDHNLIDSYARFSRSFSTIRAPDIAAEVTRQYDDGRFWPDALLSLNPRFRLCCTNRVKCAVPLSPDGLILRAQ